MYANLSTLCDHHIYPKLVSFEILTKSFIIKKTSDYLTAVEYFAWSDPARAPASVRELLEVIPLIRCSETGLVTLSLNNASFESYSHDLIALFVIAAFNNKLEYSELWLDGEWELLAIIDGSLFLAPIDFNLKKYPAFKGELDVHKARVILFTHMLAVFSETGILNTPKSSV